MRLVKSQKDIFFKNFEIQRHISVLNPPIDNIFLSKSNLVKWFPKTDPSRKKPLVKQNQLQRNYSAWEHMYALYGKCVKSDVIIEK